MKPIFWLPFIEHTRHRERAENLKKAGVPLLPSGRYGFGILRQILDYAVYKLEDISPALPESRNEGSCALSEYDSLLWLQEHGVSIPPQAVASTREEALQAAEKLRYPLSVKIHSSDIQHKSDVGGVRLNIRNEEKLRSAFDEVMENCRKNAPQAELLGVLLKPMLKTGVEMIIGVKNDRDFGPMVMVGLGGIFVELFKDVQLAPAPLSKKQAMKMIQSLKGYPMLNGYRGAAVCDTEALADLLVQISQAAADGKDRIRELDINPVFVTEDGAAIADALLIMYGDTK